MICQLLANYFPIQESRVQILKIHTVSNNSNILPSHLNNDVILLKGCIGQSKLKFHLRDLKVILVVIRARLD